MFTLLSLVTAVKDYVEVVHKLVETNGSSSFEVFSYTDLGAIVTYIVMSLKEMLVGLFTFKWLQNVTLLPFIIPNVASAMLSEISVLDGYFHNAFTFLESPISYGNQNFLVYGMEKFSIGLLNSLFLCLPTSVSHIITLRRFVMQGLEAGYLAGLGTIAGNLVWIGSIVFGLRFIVIPWLSLDLLRYGLGTLLLVKYMWDSYSERRTVLEDLSKKKIFALNFLLAFTEQATIYPFLSNLSLGSDATILETFPTASFFEYSTIHVFYLLGLFVGSLSLLQLTCWFWENPAFNIYMWAMSSLKVNNGISQRFVNLFFLYLTMLFSVANLSYFGLDYTVANPLGLVHEDRLLDQKGLLETSFLNSKSSDRNTRRNRGRHGRRERWKRRVRRYRTFDASLYDQGVYDLFTIEDLNYGFDRFWLRRKIRNHRVRFRFFPGPWMRSFKKQLAKPRLESFMGPRVEFFRILFEQSYHPEFHEFRGGKDNRGKKKNAQMRDAEQNNVYKQFQGNNLISYYSDRNERVPTENLVKENSALRKFIRKVKMRTKTAEILMETNSSSSRNLLKGHSSSENTTAGTYSSKPIYSKRWKQIFSKISHRTSQSNLNKGFEQSFLKNFYKQTFLTNETLKPGVGNYFKNVDPAILQGKNKATSAKQNSEKQLSKKDRQILRYKTFLKTTQNTNTQSSNDSKNLQVYEPMTLLHPLQFYLQKEQAFNKKMKFYGATLYRNFGVENNAPYYRIMMKKFFYYYKPTLRWERTMRTATMRKARRKGPRVPRKLNVNKQTQMLAVSSNSNIASTSGGSAQNFQTNSTDLKTEMQNTGLFSQGFGEGYTKMQKPTHFYSLVSKRATRYRYQIYKDVLQHWYYSPFNRLLLKFDVDSFIRRQPTSHFLTKKEENLLHLKRFLLYDYYNTLRWYSSMEHYDAMKKKIGKTKSFASNAYNQQFFGTFKKIRHLFAITPSLSENSILKFDQPLFNEYPNTENLKNKNGLLFNSATLHEELLADTEIYGTGESLKPLPESLGTQATVILKEYLKEATPERQNYIRKLLEEKNYTELTNFLLKGQKTRGTGPVTNESLLLDQENKYLGIESNEMQKFEKEKIRQFLNDKIMETKLVQGDKFADTLTLSDPRYAWVALLQKSKNLLYNQEALKSYVQTRVEKMEKRKKREEKAFQNRLENMKKWVNLETQPILSNSNLDLQRSEKNNLSGLRTSVQKAMKEGLYYEITGQFAGKTSEKTNLRNNRQLILQNFGQYLNENNGISNQNQDAEKTKNLSLQLKAHLTNRVKMRALETFEAEKTLRKKFTLTQELLKQQSSTPFVSNLTPSLATRIVNNTLLPFTWVSTKISKQLTDFVNLETTKKVFQPIRTTFGLFTRNSEKTLENWKKRETVLSTRKKIRRKIYRVLDQKKQQQKNYSSSELEKFMLKPNSEPTRQKQDSLKQLETDRSKKTWKSYEKTALNDKVSSNGKTLAFREIFEKNFKKKRTRSRRYRRFKGRGPIKKHTLAEKLKRQFKLLKRYGEKSNEKNKKMEILEMITKRKYNPEAAFETRELKQRRTRQSKHRYWKKHKRQKYLQMKRKQRKRRRYSISKLRVLNKEFKRIQSQTQIKKWWWQTFLPKFMSTGDALWEAERTKQIQQEFNNLSVEEILERDGKLSRSQENAMLQIGDKDFKPLSIPQALRLKERLSSQGVLNFGNKAENSTVFSQSAETIAELSTAEVSSSNNKTNVVSSLSQNLYAGNLERLKNLDSSGMSGRKMVGINPMPFYAGWDESLRQFVITNRLLSRQEAGYVLNLETGKENLPQALKTLENSNTNGSVSFTKAPLQGMNAATTLYWQIPFTTYDPDQFFALGMDGFSPLGWRFFNFKHSRETTKPMLVQNMVYTKAENMQNSSLLSYNIQLKMLDVHLKETQNLGKGSLSANNKIAKNQSRKIQKRQKRVKKHPRPPVWFPSGPLTNQVLPVHYIYVFYKRTRLPRDRYLGRRFRRADDAKASFIQANFTKLTDFTLRKRVKPIRKYHRKRNLNKGQETSLLIRRRPFKGLMEESVRFRPLTKTKLNTQTDLVNSSLLKSKQRKRSLNTKPNAENLRIRQLRRRVQRQVLRPVARYKPRPGGFVWPGDYLRLETVKAPTLKISKETTSTTDAKVLNSMAGSSQGARKKKRRAIQEWQIQPKKYLLQKHNLKVLKKRIQQSQNFQLTAQKLKTLNLML